MAIVHCSGCDKRYSSINSACPHCGKQPGGHSRRAGSGIVTNIQYLIAVILAVGGAGWYYSAVVTGRDPTYAGWMVAAGMFWYIGARLWAVLHNRWR